MEKVLTELEEYNLLKEAKEWPKEMVAQNYSFLSECARRVLESDTSGHEKQIESIKWLAFLIEFVPTFNLEIDILKPLFAAINRILNHVDSIVGDHATHSSVCGEDTVGETTTKDSSEGVTIDNGVKSAFFSIISKLLSNCNHVTSFINSRNLSQASDMPSLLHFLPKIILKSFLTLGKISSPGKMLDSEAVVLLVSFLKLLERLQISCSFVEELNLLDGVISDIIVFNDVLLCKDPNLMLQVWMVWLKVTIKYQAFLPQDTVLKQTDVIRKELCLWMALENEESESLQDKIRNMCPHLYSAAYVENIDWKVLHGVISELSALPSSLTKDDHQSLCDFVKKKIQDKGIDLLGLENLDVCSGYKPQLEVVAEGINNKQEEKVSETPTSLLACPEPAVNLSENPTPSHPLSGERMKAKRKLSTTMDDNVMTKSKSIKLSFSSSNTGFSIQPSESSVKEYPVDETSNFASDSTAGLLDKPKSFFILSESFLITPLPQTDIQLLTPSKLQKPPPDLTSSIPILGATGRLFILSSLSPIPAKVAPNNKVNKKAKVRAKKGTKLAAKIRSKVQMFKDKVLKSKLVSVNLQKQRQKNIEKFKSYIREKDGIFKCVLCGLETGLRVKAWNHSTRCGFGKKLKKRKVKERTCKECNGKFSSKKKLIKHFRAQHQKVKFICASCPRPRMFKFKYSLKRHHVLKHTVAAAESLFKCSWCLYEASQKSNLKRHILRNHKFVKMVTDLLESLLENAVRISEEEVGLSAYERIRLDRIREITRFRETLFPSPDSEIPLKKPRKKPETKALNPARRSARIFSGTVKSSQELSVKLKAGVIADSSSMNVGVSESGSEILGGEISTSGSGGGEGSIWDHDTSASSINGSCSGVCSVDPVPIRQGGTGSHGNDEIPKPKKFQCTLCDFKSTQKHSLGRHIVNKHESLKNPISCPRKFCTLNFLTRFEKEVHVRHCFIKCQRIECHNKLFSRPDKFKQHQRMHAMMDQKLEE